jgi:predicted lipoprotein with Yx(FWY)xxD motif
MFGKKNIPTGGATMKKSAMFAVFAILTLVFAGAALADHHAVKLSEKEGVGKFLVDAKGMTLYLFKKDSPGKSACAGPCVEKWPLYYREKVAVPEGVSAGDFGTITRDDGKKQTTYKGMPLYYFVGDKNPGDTTGQGVNGVWYVMNP